MDSLRSPRPPGNAQPPCAEPSPPGAAPDHGLGTLPAAAPPSSVPAWLLPGPPEPRLPADQASAPALLASPPGAPPVRLSRPAPQPVNTWPPCMDEPGEYDDDTTSPCCAGDVGGRQPVKGAALCGGAPPDTAGEPESPSKPSSPPEEPADSAGECAAGDTAAPGQARPSAPGGGAGPRCSRCTAGAVLRTASRACCSAAHRVALARRRRRSRGARWAGTPERSFALGQGCV